MSTYETIFIAPPNLAEEDERTAVETLAQVVTDGGGSWIARDRMGRRRLAYPIRKFEDGVYVRFLYDSEAAVPRELERRFRLTDNVLRYLTVRLEKEWAVQAKEDAVRDAKRRAEAAAAAEAEAVAAAAAAEAAAEAEAAAAAAEVDEPDGNTAAADADDPVAQEKGEISAAPEGVADGAPETPESGPAETEPTKDA